MANILVLTSDIPFFPGKMGVDFFNLRHLARRHHVGVVGPCYRSFPVAGLENLMRSVQECFFWYEGEPGRDEHSVPRLGRPLSSILGRLRRPLLRALGATVRDREELDKLAILSNCAPQLVRALESRRWDLLLVIQTDVAPWLDFLPSYLPKVFYVHDLRFEVLERRARLEPGNPALRRLAKRALSCERRIGREAEAMVFVSDLERRAALGRLEPVAEIRVAPIAIDLDYLEEAPRSPRENQVVLFTGHLGHPPNIDAVLYLTREVWPLLRQRHPEAMLRVVGCFPAPEVVEACRSAAVELHRDVPDIRPFFRLAAVFVVPMRFGGGVRQKILEAWAMGVPVVATPMAVEGLEPRHELPCLIAENPRDLAARLAEVLEQGSGITSLVTSGKAAVRAHGQDRACRVFEREVLRAPAIRRRKALRVAIDLGWMIQGGWRSCDAEASNLVEALLALGAGLEWSLLAPPPGFAPARVLTVPRSAHGNRFSTAVFGSIGGHPVDLEKLRLLARLKADFVLTFLDRVSPGIRSMPMVLHVPDLGPLFERGESDPLINIQLTNWRAQAEQAERLLCPLESTREAICLRWGLSRQRVRVAPTWALAGPALRLASPWRRRLGIPKRYVFANTAQGLEQVAEACSAAGVGWVTPPDLATDPTPSGEVRLPAGSWRERRAVIAGARRVVLADDSPQALADLGEALAVGTPALVVGGGRWREVEGDTVFCGGPELGRTLSDLLDGDDLKQPLARHATPARDLGLARRAVAAVVSTLFAAARWTNEDL